MIYGELTSPQLAKIARRTVAVLPIAAIEQHGDHLPVLTDTAIAEELGRLVEKGLPRKIVLLPVLWCGSSHHHKGFPGALSLRSETYVEVLIDLVESLIETGFQRIFLLNCHGGNQTPFAEALFRLNLKYRKKDEPWIVAASYWNLASTELAEQGFMETSRLSHACEYETSLMMALRMDWIGPSPRAKIRLNNSPKNSRFYDPSGIRPSQVVIAKTFDQLSSNGALGSPERASAEKGEKLFALVNKVLIEFLEEFSTWKRQAPSKTRKT